MPARRFHARLLMLLALLAFGGQGAVLFESAWHHHEHNQSEHGHEDGCTICMVVSQTGAPAADLPAVEAPAPVALVRIAGQALPAHLYAAPAIAPRGPPALGA